LYLRTNSRLIVKHIIYSKEGPRGNSKSNLHKNGLQVCVFLRVWGPAPYEHKQKLFAAHICNFSFKHLSRSLQGKNFSEISVFLTRKSFLFKYPRYFNRRACLFVFTKKIRNRVRDYLTLRYFL
jgi:hypothetical protein